MPKITPSKNKIRNYFQPVEKRVVNNGEQKDIVPLNKQQFYRADLSEQIASTIV